MMSSARLTALNSICASACSSAARPSGEAGERCRSCCGDTSPGAPAGPAARGSVPGDVPYRRWARRRWHARRPACRPSHRPPARAGPGPADRRRLAGGYCCSYAGFQWRAPATRRPRLSRPPASGRRGLGPQPGRLYHCPMDSSPRLTIETDLSRIDARQWDALAGDQPFLRHAFCGQCTRPAAPRHGPAGRRTTWRCGAARRWPAPCRCT